ncbi:MAG: hypothetical protein MRY57_02635 [Candidatus Pacebacteria bacterium]|nr:hypothetical protein [Candidatus Paceibacterota bacterium]
MKTRKMFILGGFGTSSPKLTRYIELEALAFLAGENLEPELAIIDPEEAAVKMIENENAAFIWIDDKVPGSIYNYFSSPEGMRIIQTYNITLGYLNMKPTTIEKLVYCLNKTGKIHKVAKPQLKKAS